MEHLENTITETVGGQPVKLLKRTPRQRARLTASAHAWAKERRADNLRLSGVDGEALADALDAIDAFDPDRREAEWCDYFNDPAGQLEALELALAGNPGAERIIEAIFEEGRALEVVARIWGIALVPIKGGKPAEPAADPALTVNPSTGAESNPAGPFFGVTATAAQQPQPASPLPSTTVVACSPTPTAV